LRYDVLVTLAKKLAWGAAAVGAGVLSWWEMTLHPRDRFLRAARWEIGSKNWKKYFRKVVIPPGEIPDAPPYWCGIFALWALRKAGFACSVHWDIRTGRGFLHLLQPTTNPQPGDLAYIHNYQHHAIIERITPDGMVHTIDGNTGPDNRVARKVRPRSEFAFFYDTTPLFQLKC
jgi:hypothetical protein